MYILTKVATLMLGLDLEALSLLPLEKNKKLDQYSLKNPLLKGLAFKLTVTPNIASFLSFLFFFALLMLKPLQMMRRTCRKIVCNI